MSEAFIIDRLCSPYSSEDSLLIRRDRATRPKGGGVRAAIYPAVLTLPPAGTEANVICGGQLNGILHYAVHLLAVDRAKNGFVPSE